jgi:uncharacterized membrane protein YbhN (UPF0104 family)
MTSGWTNDDVKLPGRAAEKLTAIAIKLVVTGLSFWYLWYRLDLSEISHSISLLDFGWVTLAVLTVMLQILLVAIRWLEILRGLAATYKLISGASILAITAIGVFFAQVLPNVASEAVRAWLIVRIGSDWRHAVSSVAIDRGVGAGLMIALGVVILLLSPGLSELGGYSTLVLAVYGSLLLIGLALLALLPALMPLLDRVRYLRWLAQFMADARRVLLGPRSPMILGLGALVHGLTIFIIWSLARAQGLMLPFPDVVCLFVVIMGVALVPASINGWGLREIAVVGVLGSYGVAPEKALVFSICFGLTLAIGSLPGAIVWLLYPTARVKYAQTDAPRRGLAG